MDSQVKFYRYVVFLMISVSVCLSVYRYLSRGDFLVYARVECNRNHQENYIPIKFYLRIHLSKLF